MSGLPYHYTYTRYIESLPDHKRCACRQHVLGRCPVCSQPPQKEQLSLIPEPDQLSFTFTTISNIYEQE